MTCIYARALAIKIFKRGGIGAPTAIAMRSWVFAYSSLQRLTSLSSKLTRTWTSVEGGAHIRRRGAQRAAPRYDALVKALCMLYNIIMLFTLFLGQMSRVIALHSTHSGLQVLWVQFYTSQQCSML